MSTEYFVTDIKEINSRRRLVYVNYEPAFALYPAEIKKYKIKKEEYISEENYKEITEVLLAKRAKLRAMNLLKSKDYTVNELTKKLADNYYPQQSIDIAIEYVSSYGYLNDKRYVQNYVNFKAASKSRKQIELFLYNKGINREIISSVCDEYYDDNADVEIDQAVKYIYKKIGTKDIKSIDYAEKGKISAYLYRHGFGMEVIKKALDIVVEQISED